MKDIKKITRIDKDWEYWGPLLEEVIYFPFYL